MTANGPGPDDALRRQLRFALFLQASGALLFGIACVVRAVALGVDIVTAIFGLVTILILAAVAVTAQKLRTLAR